MAKELSIGNKYNRLTVLKLDHVKNYSNYYLCKCDCGNEKVIEARRILDNTTKSCGCYQKEARITCKNMTGTPFHNIWRGIKQRCLSPTCKTYKHYGGMGIKICDRWLVFNNFYDDMYESYCKHVEEFGRKDTTIDRINVDGDYEPSNCKWATRSEQAINKRNVMLVYDNESMENISLPTYCKYHNLSYSAVLARLRNRWSFEDAVSIPLRQFYGNQYRKDGVNYDEISNDTGSQTTS